MKKIAIIALALLALAGGAYAEATPPPALVRSKNLSDVPNKSLARSNIGLAGVESLAVDGHAGGMIYQPVDSGFGPATPMNRTFGEKFTDEYHVRDWKASSGAVAKCDTVEVYDISSSSGSATFTSAGAYSYKAAHQGKQVYVVSFVNADNPAVNGTGLGSVVTASGTVLSGNGNSLTLTGAGATANRTRTNQYMVVYMNDDTAALTALIESASKKGGRLVFPNGTCAVSASLPPMSRTLLSGQGITATKIIARPGMSGAVIKSKNYDALAGQPNTNYGVNPLTQAYYGLRNMRIDGASFAQAAPNKCVQLHGNAVYLDSVEILNCSDAWETEAANTYANSALDPTTREEWYANNVFVRNFTGKGWRNRGGHDWQGGHILIFNSLASSDWGYTQECDGSNYGGNGYFESLHVYPGPNAINIACGATRFGTLYTDLGRTEVTGGNVKVGQLKVLGCGYGRPEACLRVSGKSFEANVEFGWFSDTNADISGIVGVDIEDAAEGWRINMSDAGVVNTKANAVVFRNRADHGSLTGKIAGANGTGGLCVDLGGAIGEHRFTTKTCKTHLDYKAAPESYRNIINWASFVQAGETGLVGSPNASDIFCSTETAHFRGCVSARHTLRADNGNFVTLRPSAASTTYDFFFPDAPGAAGAPMISNGVGVAHGYGSKTGNTNNFVTATGTFTAGNILKWDASGNAIDGGPSPGGGGPVDLDAGTTGILPVIKGGSGTGSPGLIEGPGIDITGTWPNQTITATGAPGGGGSAGGNNGDVQINNSGALAGVATVPMDKGGTSQATKFGAQSALGVMNYVLAANNAGIPNNFFTNTNTVMHTVTTHLTGPANYSCFRLKYVNWYLGTTSENQGQYAFTVRSSIYDGARFHRVTFNGKNEALVGKTWGTNEVWSDPMCGVKIGANKRFKVYTRRVAAEVFGSYNHLTNTSGQGFRQDGLIQGADATVDYTMGVGIAYGATYLTPVVNGSGVMTSIPVDPDRQGVGYTAGQNLFCYYGGAGANQPGSIYPGSGAGAGGFCNFSTARGGISSGTSLGSGGTGYSSVNPPICGCGGAGNAATGFGTPTSNYGPAAIVAIADRPTCSLALEGDSITAGWTSVDSTGDINGSHGLYEQKLAGTCGIAKVAVSGESALGRLTQQTRRDAFWADLVANGVRLTHAVVAYGTNDFLSNTNSNVITVTQNYMTAIRDKFKVTLGVPKVYAPTVWPAVTVGSSKVDKTLMTPYNVNFNAAGRVSQYNTALIGGAPLFDGVIRADYAFDAVDTHLPRVNAYVPADKACNTNTNLTVDGLPDTTGLFVGMGIKATGIPAGATITAVAANSVTISTPATATATVTCSFATAYLAGDGVHPSVAVGIPHSILNMTYPSFSVP